MLNPINLISKLFKSQNQKELDRLKKIVAIINNNEEKFKKFTQEEFSNKTIEFKQKIKNGSSLDSILPEAFALVREAAFRTLGERHYDVQLISGIAMHEGKLVEMKTGEGKTLTATLPAYLNSLEEKGVHIISVNDFLSSRDQVWMGKVYSYLGISSGCVTNEMNNQERKKNYNCDITYLTNSEAGFDYLRDNLNYSLSEMVQRNHYYAIVDECDSVLIDEARTPLVISGPTEDKTSQYQAIDKLVRRLDPSDFELDEKDKNVLLTNKGIDSIENIFSKAGILKNNNFYDPENLNLVHHVSQALKANHLFSSGKDYIVKENEVVIIDEFSGRILSGRRFSDGLHQALEAKENVPIQSENHTIASITYQNYFRLYKRLSGMTGTAKTEAQEFYDIYNLPVIAIPTNKPMVRKDWNDKIFQTEKEKNDAIVNKIIECNKKGQPVLLGTTNINKSELYSSIHKEKNVKHTVLNAKQHEKEAEIIADAGKLNAVTVATNLAGRGQDIKLGGKKDETHDDINDDQKNEIKKLGGLFVIGTERHESRRIDNQLRGRSGRQGDEGNSIFYISLEDDLMRIFGSESMNNILKKLGLKENESIDHPWINKALERAQEKVEARNYDIRKTLLKFDDVMNDQRQVIFSQRNDILNNNNIYDLTNSFLKEIISNLQNERDISKKDLKDKSVNLKVRALFGKSSNDEATNEIISSNDLIFEKKIKDIFNAKREDRKKILGDEQNKEIERRIFIQTIDMNWRNHLQYLDNLRGVIGLISYGQKDPLIEYKKEAFGLFENLLEKTKLDLITILNNLNIVEKQEMEERKKDEAKPIKINTNMMGKKIGRNEPCFCGSGKKYKYCCGALQ